MRDKIETVWVGNACVRGGARKVRSVEAAQRWLEKQRKVDPKGVDRGEYYIDVRTFRRVVGGMNEVRCYEVFESAAEKKRAGRGVGRKVPSGKARGYALVDWRREVREWNGSPQMVAPLCRLDPGASPPRSGYGGWHMTFGSASHRYVWENCRAVGFRYIPKEWQECLLDCGWFKIVNGVLYELVEE